MHAGEYLCHLVLLPAQDYFPIPLSKLISRQDEHAQSGAIHNANSAQIDYEAICPLIDEGNEFFTKCLGDLQKYSSFLHSNNVDVALGCDFDCAE